MAGDVFPFKFGRRLPRVASVSRTRCRHHRDVALARKWNHGGAQRAPLANIGTIFLTVSTIATPEKRKRPNLYEFG
jgi:hypothetical protein